MKHLLRRAAALSLAAAMTLEGKSCICENVFEDRLRTAEELQKMGGTLHPTPRRYKNGKAPSVYF